MKFSQLENRVCENRRVSGRVSQFTSNVMKFSSTREPGVWKPKRLLNMIQKYLCSYIHLYKSAKTEVSYQVDDYSWDLRLSVLPGLW